MTEIPDLLFDGQTYRHFICRGVTDVDPNKPSIIFCHASFRTKNGSRWETHDPKDGWIDHIGPSPFVIHCPLTLIWEGMEKCQGKIQL